MKKKYVCSECLEDFDGKYIFVAEVPTKNYSTHYCQKCLKELEITTYKPLYKKKLKNN